MSDIQNRQNNNFDEDFTASHVHFIGIGGIGMSALAELLNRKGKTVTGSDLQESDITANLKSMGVGIKKGHHANNLAEETELVVITAAVDETNPELSEAKRLKIPVIKRADLLGLLSKSAKTVAIAGTHGKTTTTAMIGHMLVDTNFDPTVLVGGISINWNSNLRVGSGDYLVVEADEYDRSFLTLHPDIAIVTNLELEHMDIYRDFDDLKNAFFSFIYRLPPDNATIILCNDDAGIREIVIDIYRQKYTYSIRGNADFSIVDRHSNGTDTSFTVMYQGEPYGDIDLHIPGDHMVQNSLAAIAVGRHLGIPFDDIASSLKSFRGVKRRFELKKKINGITIIDDYAHHPTEITATLRTTKYVFPSQRIIAVFQPHLYTRTQYFARSFGESLSSVDVVVITDVYPAREDPIEGVTGKIIADEAKKHNKNVHYINNKREIPGFLTDFCNNGDVVITMGAGDIDKIGEDFYLELENK